MKKKIAPLIVVIAVVGTAMFGILRSETTRDLEVRDPSTESTDVGSGQDDTDLNEASCQDAGGTWNPCGSACRTDPDAICIELCVEYCECETDLQCPSGFVCSDVIEGVGVCL